MSAALWLGPDAPENYRAAANYPVVRHEFRRRTRFAVQRGARSVFAHWSIPSFAAATAGLPTTRWREIPPTTAVQAWQLLMHRALSSLFPSPPERRSQVLST